MNMLRVGFGCDVHELVDGRDLILGGVAIASEKGLSGHSDADVLTHAIIDALLGAAALGDIGTHFPDSDKAYRGADSIGLLGRVREMLDQRGYSINNVDASIVIELPRIAPYIEAMKGRLSQALCLAPERISVKATTSEGIGFVGRGEGATAYAVCAVEQGE